MTEGSLIEPYTCFRVWDVGLNYYNVTTFCLMSPINYGYFQCYTHISGHDISVQLNWCVYIPTVDLSDGMNLLNIICLKIKKNVPKAFRKLIKILLNNMVLMHLYTTRQYKSMQTRNKLYQVYTCVLHEVTFDKIIRNCNINSLVLEVLLQCVSTSTCFGMRYGMKVGRRQRSKTLIVYIVGPLKHK